ncbi:MAG: restriction endonuclease subunit S [Alphaproteobacteria bacterium]|nr:restriction endonuclease subunit S [Alphaproteobacteria bacterium]
MKLTPFIALDAVREAVPEDKVEYHGKAEKYFDFLANNSNLTEEYLYAHQPTEDSKISVYATNSDPIGHLDRSEVERAKLEVLKGPVIVVARKGYAGRLFVVNDDQLIVHEDAYAVKPKKAYLDKIDLNWFAQHYSFEFQSNRTSLWGIGDFPREKFRSMVIKIPSLSHQRESASLYARRDKITRNLIRYRSEKEKVISDAIYRTSHFN